MKILFVACYINNPHYIALTKTTLDKYLHGCTYDFLCLNDAPDIDSGEENYLKICDILTESPNCYNKIVEEAARAGFHHIKIPQSLHNDKARANHSSPRHIENLNWFNQNIATLFPAYREYDFICHVDSDAFFVKHIDLAAELADCDMAGPFIYLSPTSYYIHTGLFFINLRTVTNMCEISWTNTMGTDTGSDIANFISANSQYRIKKMGHYDGYSVNNGIANGHTIITLKIDDITDEFYKLVDRWFDGAVYHFRAGSCFGVGTLRHRNEDRLFLYNKKYEAFMRLFE